MSFSGFEGKSQGRDFYSWLYWIIQRTSQRAQGDTKKKRPALVLREFTVLLWSLWTVLFLCFELMTQWLPLGNTSFTRPMPMEEPQVKLQKIQGPNAVLAERLFTGLSAASPTLFNLKNPLRPSPSAIRTSQRNMRFGGTSHLYSQTQEAVMQDTN